MGKLRNCSPMSRSPIHNSVDMALTRPSALGSQKFGAHKQSFNPDTDASYTIQMSSVPFGTAK